MRGLAFNFGFQRSSRNASVVGSLAAVLAFGCAGVPNTPGMPDEIGVHHAAVAGLWEFAGTMTASGDTATLLLDGRVLATGNSGATLAADLYDPATNGWNATGAPHLTQGASATLLESGKVFLAGGHGNLPYNSMSTEIYNPATGTWSQGPTMPSNHAFHSATRLADGRVLIAGGGSYPYARHTELYDPATGTITPAGWLNEPRTNHTATLLPSGKVLVAGGTSESSTGTFIGPINTAELYDPASNTWTATGNLQHARTMHAAAMLPGGFVLVAGGYDSSYVSFSSAEIYYPTTGAWLSASSMLVGRQGARAVALPSGKVLVAGGVTLTSSELYDPSTQSWTQTGDLTRTRDDYGAVLMPTGKVLVASNGSAELYDPGWPGTCNVCPGDGTCTQLPAGAACGMCSACSAAGSCGPVAPGSACGLCEACNGAGQCTDKPLDDPACGVIDCQGLGDACRTYSDATANRCLTFGACKPANDPATCTAFTDASCDDGNPCTDDSCDPATGCISSPNTAACDDGDPCTRDDVCGEGTCRGTHDPQCGVDGGHGGDDGGGAGGCSVSGATTGGWLVLPLLLWLAQRRRPRAR